MANLKKYFKVTTERNVVTPDFDENYFDEFLITEEVFVEWARKMTRLGWKITLDSDIVLQAEDPRNNPSYFSFRRSRKLKS